MQPASPLTAQPPPSLTAPRLTLGSITSKGNNLPNRYILHAVEGYGKTSLAAQFPKPVFIQSRGETGLETLIDAGRLPETPHFPEITDWAVLLEAIRMLTTEKHDYKTLVIDTMNGVERLCHEFVCRRDFGNNWGERGFEGYKRGYEIALTDWRSFLQLLDSLREQRRMIVMLLCHTKVLLPRFPSSGEACLYLLARRRIKTWTSRSLPRSARRDNWTTSFQATPVSSMSLISC